MDGHRFDGIAKSFADGVSRRGVLKTLLAGIGAAALGLAGRDGADAARICRVNGQLCRTSGIGGDCCSGFCGPKDVNGRRHCACPTGSILCGGVCVAPGTTSTNCGCGVQCTKCEDCVAGVCAPVADDSGCASGRICCAGQCVSDHSPEHCGTCAKTCAQPLGCAAGACCLQEGATCAFAVGAQCCVGACLQGSGICGLIPTGFLCTPGRGDTCSSGTCSPQDDGSYCAPNGAAGTCRVDGDCISGLCQGSVCACTGAGGSCAVEADCCDRPCDNGVCRYIPTGQLCLAASPACCSSGTCNPYDVGYFCDPNGVGGTCREDIDCTTGLTCASGVCG